VTVAPRQNRELEPEFLTGLRGSAGLRGQEKAYLAWMESQADLDRGIFAKESIFD
jgi:hypothetical protein